MYCRVIAYDFERTGPTDGRPAPELYAALAATRALGIVMSLVTPAACSGLRNRDGAARLVALRNDLSKAGDGHCSLEASVRRLG